MHLFDHEKDYLHPWRGTQRDDVCQLWKFWGLQKKRRVTLFHRGSDASFDRSEEEFPTKKRDYYYLSHILLLLTSVPQ